ncbi:MAG: ATP-dependent Lon protease [Actinomycetota bacterium]|nr:ATP-dependent Lon protease [Actinomycetota bacterium]
MFPLGSVVFPQQSLPLHVFEERYRALVRDCLASDRTFGVVLIERGSEVGGGDVRFDVGCTAGIVHADELPDGRWSLLTAGVSRLRILEWLPDDPYPRADVALGDGGSWDTAAEGAFDHALSGFARVVALADQLGYAIDPRVLELPGEAVWDHWVLSARAPIGELDRYALLAARTPAERMQLLGTQLAELEAVLATRLAGG